MPAAAEPRNDDSGRAVPRRVWTGTLLQVAGRVFGSACTFATLALLARGLPAAEFGRYTFYLALFGVLDALADFGTGHAVVRLTADHRGALVPVLVRARRMRALMAGLGIVGLALYASLREESGGLWIVLAGFYPVTHAFELTATVFKNRIAWRIPVAVRAMASATRLAFVVGLLYLGTDEAPVILFATALASASANVMLHFVARPYVHDAREPDPAARSAATLQASRLFATAWPVGLGSLCAISYFYVDNLFLRAWTDDVALGHYNGAVRLLSFLIMIAQLASATALPWLVRRHARGDIGTGLADLGQPLFAAAGLVCGLLWFQAGPLLELCFTASFRPATSSFQWLLAAAAVIHAGAMFVTALIAIGSTRAFLLVAATGLVVNLIGNALLIPRLGIEGAALATLATEVTVAVAALVCLVRAGARPLARRPSYWLAGPALFVLGAWLSHLTR